MISRSAAGVRVRIRLTPKAARDRVDGLALEADGSHVLKISVTTVPEDGKANLALIKFLSKAWKVPKSSIELVQGATDRRKVLEISGDGPALEEHLTQWMASIK